MEVVESWVSSEFNCQPSLVSQTVRHTHTHIARTQSFTYIHTGLHMHTHQHAEFQLDNLENFLCRLAYARHERNLSL